MAAGRAKAVLFDYGNVLVDWDPRHLYRQLFADPAEMDWFHENVCTMDWHLRHDSGEPMTVTTAELAKKHPKYADAIRAWDTRFCDMIGPEIAGSVALLDEVKAQGLKVGVLTNMPADQAWVCFRNFSRWAALDTIIVSGFVKMAKPGADVFRLALHALDREAHEVFFVDDSPKNVAAAEALGIASHLFRAPDAFGEALRKAGFLA